MVYSKQMSQDVVHNSDKVNVRKDLNIFWKVVFLIIGLSLVLLLLLNLVKNYQTRTISINDVNKQKNKEILTNSDVKVSLVSGMDGLNIPPLQFLRDGKFTLLDSKNKVEYQLHEDLAPGNEFKYQGKFRPNFADEFYYLANDRLHVFNITDRKIYQFKLERSFVYGQEEVARSFIFDDTGKYVFVITPRDILRVELGDIKFENPEKDIVSKGDSVYAPSKLSPFDLFNKWDGVSFDSRMDTAGNDSLTISVSATEYYAQLRIDSLSTSSIADDAKLSLVNSSELKAVEKDVINKSEKKYDNSLLIQVNTMTKSINHQTTGTIDIFNINNGDKKNLVSFDIAKEYFFPITVLQNKSFYYLNGIVSQLGENSLNLVRLDTTGKRTILEKKIGLRDAWYLPKYNVIFYVRYKHSLLGSEALKAPKDNFDLYAFDLKNEKEYLLAKSIYESSALDLQFSALAEKVLLPY